MKDSSPTAAIWGVSAFVRNRTAARRQRRAANGSGGAGRKTRTTSAAAITASGSGGGEGIIPTTAAATRLRPKVRYKMTLQPASVPCSIAVVRSCAGCTGVPSFKIMKKQPIRCPDLMRHALRPVSMPDRRRFLDRHCPHTNTDSPGTTGGRSTVPAPPLRIFTPNGTAKAQTLKNGNHDLRLTSALLLVFCLLFSVLERSGLLSSPITSNP